MQIQKKTMAGIYQMLIPTDADLNAFEKLTKTDVFPTVEVGNQTRGCNATAQYFLKKNHKILSATTPGSFTGKTREAHPLVLEMLPPILPPN